MATPDTIIMPSEGQVRAFTELLTNASTLHLALTNGLTYSASTTGANVDTNELTGDSYARQAISINTGPTYDGTDTRTEVVFTSVSFTPTANKSYNGIAIIRNQGTDNEVVAAGNYTVTQTLPANVSTPVVVQVNIGGQGVTVNTDG